MRLYCYFSITSFIFYLNPVLCIIKFLAIYMLSSNTSPPYLNTSSELLISDYDLLFDRKLYQSKDLETKLSISFNQEIIVKKVFNDIQVALQKKNICNWVETTTKIKQLIHLLNQSRFKDYNNHANELFYQLKIYAKEVLKIEMVEFTLASRPVMLSPLGLKKSLEREKYVHSSETEFIDFFRIFLKEHEKEAFCVIYLTNSCHYIPIYLRKEEDTCKMLITDSIGNGNEYIQDIFEKINYSINFNIEIYNYFVERQNDYGNCGIFSISDMHRLSKMKDFAIFNFADKFFKTRTKMKWNHGFIEIKNFDTLPPRLSEVTQSCRILDLNTKRCQENEVLTEKDYQHLQKKRDKHRCFDHQTRKEINQSAIDEATKCNLYVLEKWIDNSIRS